MFVFEQRLHRALVFALFLACIVPSTANASEHEILLWPNGAPGEAGTIEAEKINDPKGSKPVTRITNVTAPTLTVFRPEPSKDTGTTVIVCPGGGYNILAYDLEGTEIVAWLNSIGVTGVLLKYRVPRRLGLEKHTAPLQDAQRALGIVRHRSERWGIAPDRIGILGFSAGGHLSAMASTHFDQRVYPRTDASDDVSCRPDFSILIYPAYLSKEGNRLELADELTIHKNTPPCILIQTQDDGVKVESSIAYYLGLKQAKIPVEMHLYPSGGHGYGLRSSEHLVSSWPNRCEEWLRQGKLLIKRN